MINYIKGNVLDASNDKGNFNVIIHCVNNKFVMGAGVAKALRDKWPVVYEEYVAEKDNLKLGDYQWVRVEEDTWVVNLFGQDGVGLDKDGKPPVRYDALYNALNELGKDIEPDADVFSIASPRIASGLAGGDWQIIEAIIKSTLVDRGISVTVYDFN